MAGRRGGCADTPCREGRTISVLHATGPVDIWCQWESSPVFLGFGTRAPHLEIRPVQNPVMCDLTAGAPIDKVYASEVGVVSVELVRFNMIVVERLQSRASNTAVPVDIGPRGFNPPGRLGSLLVAEGCAPRLFLRFPYWSKQAMINARLPRGYRFLAATLMPDASDFGASDAVKIRLTWECLPVLDTSVTNTFGVFGTKLYDHDMTAIGGNID